MRKSARLSDAIAVSRDTNDLLPPQGRHRHFLRQDFIFPPDDEDQGDPTSLPRLRHESKTKMKRDSGSVHRQTFSDRGSHIAVGSRSPFPLLQSSSDDYVQFA